MGVNPFVHSLYKDLKDGLVLLQVGFSLHDIFRILISVALVRAKPSKIVS